MVRLPSFPRSAWERTAATLCVADKMPRWNTMIRPTPPDYRLNIEQKRATRCATQSVAAVRSHAERGNEVKQGMGIFQNDLRIWKGLRYDRAQLAESFAG